MREKRLDSAFWTVDLFMAELDNLLDHLGIADDFDLFGHSWGGMLGAEFAIRGHKGLNRLIIASSPASMPLFTEACNSWRSELPTEIEDALQRHEKAQTYYDPEFTSAVEEFYKRHLCRVWPFPKNLTDTFALAESDDTVYMTMNGPSEFTHIGNLKDWSTLGRLHNIHVPVLLVNGAYDEAKDRYVCLVVETNLLRRSSPLFHHMPGAPAGKKEKRGVC
jgi:L-proline amide hydrolase